MTADDILVGGLFIIFVTPFIVARLLEKSEAREAKEKERRIKILKETMAPYDFYREVKSANNQSFHFMNIHSGDLVRVKRRFKDYNGCIYEPGEKFYFACTFFLPYDNGYTLYISKDKETISHIFLQDRSDAQEYILKNTEEYFEKIKVH